MSYCAACDGVQLVFEPDQHLFACPNCGLVDERQTWAAGLVSVTDKQGAILDDSTASSSKAVDLVEQVFQDRVRKLLKFYLEDVSILGFPCPTLYASSLAWFDKMREAEKTLHKRIRKSTNIETRRLPYFVALAIKFAAQESSLVTLNNRLPAATKTPSSVRGGAKGDEKVPLLSLKDIHDRASLLKQDHFAYIGSQDYLVTLWKRYSKALCVKLSSLDLCLCHVRQCVERIRGIVNRSPSERRALLVTMPKFVKTSTKAMKGNKAVPWEESWDWFNRIDLDAVLPVAYGLYEAQRCVMLWSPRFLIAHAVALTLIACQSVASEALVGMSSNIAEELCTWLGKSASKAMTCHMEISKLVIAWSTTIPDVKGITFPTGITFPRSGGLGDGVSRYGSDKRRGIPPADIAAAAGRTIAENWQAIALCRRRNRSQAMDFQLEQQMAQRIFARLTPDPITVKKRGPPGHAHAHYLYGTTPSEPSTPCEWPSPPLLSIHDLPDHHIHQPAKTNSQILRDLEMLEPDSSSAESVTSSADDATLSGLGLNIPDKVANPNAKYANFRLSLMTRTPPTVSPGPGYDSVSEASPLLPSASLLSDYERGSSSEVEGATKMSRTSSIDSRSSMAPLVSVNDIFVHDQDHVGQLIREGPQYRQFKSIDERREGRVVPEDVERVMKTWIVEQKAAGHWDTPNLRELGINGPILGDNRVSLDGYVQSMQSQMHPVEALLRIGIKPIELPMHLIPHSIIAARAMLYHYNKPDPLAPVGEAIDDAQLDRELEYLFPPGKNFESWADIKLSDRQSKERAKAYEAEGLWEIEEDEAMDLDGLVRFDRDGTVDAAVEEGITRRLKRKGEGAGWVSDDEDDETPQAEDKQKTKGKKRKADDQPKGRAKKTKKAMFDADKEEN